MRKPRFLIAALLTAVLALAMTPAPATAALDSKGTDFWLTFPRNHTGSPELTLFITGDTLTTGVVTIPGLGFVAPFAVTPGSVTSVALPTAASVNTNDVVENKGIHVTALAEVTVYGLSRIPFTTDAYLGLPTDILGTDYINVGYKNVNIVNGSEFAIVAAENATTVTITPSNTAGIHPAGVPYNVLLNQGQTYQLQDTGLAPDDLSGSLITSDKPIAVFGGHQCANIPNGSTVACDHVVEQLTPTTTWGESFVTAELATRIGGDTWRILAGTNGTTVNVNGVPVATLNKGQLHEQIIDGHATITANNPVLVMQYSNGTSYDNVTSDPFQMMIPPREQFLASYTVTTPASGFNINYINLVVPNAAVGAVILDGTPIPAGQYTAIGASGFSATQQSVSLGTHNMSGPAPFGAFMYGFAQADSYGYPGGMALGEVASVTSVTISPKTATNPVNTEHCVDATVRDQNNQPVEGVRVDFSVSGPNGPRTGFAFTNASGVARFCYTGTNTGTDTITASVGALSDTATKTWTGGGDATPPDCRIFQTIAGPPTQLVIRTQDTGSGLASIIVTKSQNANTVVPPFAPGTNDPVDVTATKINQSMKAVVTLRVTDMAGNVTNCDPVVATMKIRKARVGLNGATSQWYAGLPQAESKITLVNGRPGVRTVRITVNGGVFATLRLKYGQKRTINVAKAMYRGELNRIALLAKGKRGSSVLVVIAD